MHDASRPDLETRLRHARERIDREFAGVAHPETVDRCVSTALTRIADARVPDFAPIFFARHVRQLLREAASAASEQRAALGG